MGMRCKNLSRLMCMLSSCLSFFTLKGILWDLTAHHHHS